MLRISLQIMQHSYEHAKLFLFIELSSCALQFKYFLKDPVKYDVKYQVYNNL